MTTTTDAPEIITQASGTTTDLDRPRPLSENELRVHSTEHDAPAPPTLEPPTQAGGAITAIGAWQADKRVTAFWFNSSTRNAFMHVAGVGWKRLNPANDSAWSALVMLAQQARQTGCRIDYRDEADGLVHDIYLW